MHTCRRTTSSSLAPGVLQGGRGFLCAELTPPNGRPHAASDSMGYGCCDGIRRRARRGGALHLPRSVRLATPRATAAWKDTSPVYYRLALDSFQDVYLGSGGFNLRLVELTGAACRQIGPSLLELDQGIYKHHAHQGWMAQVRRRAWEEKRRLPYYVRPSAFPTARSWATGDIRGGWKTWRGTGWRGRSLAGWCS